MEAARHDECENISDNKWDGGFTATLYATPVTQNVFKLPAHIDTHITRVLHLLNKSKFAIERKIRGFLFIWNVAISFELSAYSVCLKTGDMAWAVSEAQRGGGRNRGDIQNWCHIGIKITYIDTMHESWQRLASYTSHHHISSSATRRVRRHDKWWRKVLVMSPATRMLRKHETLKYTRCVAKSVATKEPCRPCCKLYISHERCDVIHSK